MRSEPPPLSLAHSSDFWLGKQPHPFPSQSLLASTQWLPHVVVSVGFLISQAERMSL